jgi:hypothetical protein
VSWLFEMESPEEKGPPSARVRPIVDGARLQRSLQWDMGGAVVREILGKMPAKRRAVKRGTPIGGCLQPGSATDRRSRQGSAGRNGEHGRRRHREPELQQLTVDSRSAPEIVLRGHAPNEASKL